jgi:L(+)-tartrate dehydratase beta subunit
MSIHTLSTPISEESIRSIKAGDLVFLTGTLVTARDDVHLRLVKQGDALPTNLKDGAIFHAGPIMTPIVGEEGRYEVISIGPTTSMRMERYEKDFIEQTGVRLIVGKGGMGPRTAEACVESGCLHVVFPGGCAVLAASQVVEVKSVHWLDLGMPEALWEMEVKNFGPLLVSIDAHGNNLFEEQKVLYNERKESILENLNQFIEETFRI